MLTVLGVAVVPQLMFRLYPSEAGKIIYISYSYYGASASAIEMDVTAPLEGVVNTIEGIKNVSSVSGEGWGEITLEFEKDVNAEKVRFRVLSAIREVYQKLPEGVTYPTISAFTNYQQNMVQLMVYAISSTLDPPVLKELAQNKLIAPLSQVEGVSSVELYGANSNDWYIEYRPELMDLLGITPEQIQAALRREGYYASIGINQSQHLLMPIILVGSGLNANCWNELEVANVNGRIVTLGQVAKIEMKERDPNGFYRINGQTAVNMVIRAASDANQIAVANRVMAIISNLSNDLPQSVVVEKTYDSTIQIRNDLRKSVLRTFFSVAILLLFVLISTRSFRYLLVVTISLLVNLALALLLYFALKIEIHLYSLSGITLSLGLIIDATLVMVDHIRHRHNIMVFTALLAATLTTIGALASIFFLEEEQQRNLVDFAWVIIVNLGVSLLIALFLIPSLVQKIMHADSSKRIGINVQRVKVKLSLWYQKFSNYVQAHSRIAVIAGIFFVGLPVFLLPDKIDDEGFWANIYNKTIGSSFYQVRIKPYSDKVLGGTLRLFYNSAWEKSTWGIPERTRVFVRFSLPLGSTLQMADGIGRLYESHILSYPQVERSITNISGKTGMIEIFFTPEHENGTFPFILKSNLEKLANTQAAADFNIYGVGLGFSNSSSFNWANSQILLTGYSHKQLMSWARAFADSLRMMPRVDKIWIKGGQSWNFSDEYKRFLDLDPEMLLSGGTSSLEYARVLSRNAPISDRTLWQSVSGHVSLMRIRPQGEIISDFDMYSSPLKVGNRYFRTNKIGSFRNEMVSDEIYKKNQQYIITLAYNLIGPDKLIKKVEEEQVERINRALPVGFRAEIPKYSWGNKNSGQQYLLIALMVLIIYTITSVLFESLIRPLAVIVLIPLSFVGVFLTYWLFDLSFDQGTFAAFILLGGLVVNSAIYIINEQANLLRKYQNLSSINAYKRAVNAKIAPIVLTVISTVLGLLPFVTFGEEPFWFSLAAGTIGGLIFSIPMLLIFLPALPGVVREVRKK